MRISILSSFILISLTACNQVSPNSAPAVVLVAPLSTVIPIAPTSIANPYSLLVWGGKGSNGADLGCLLATLDQQGVNFQVVSENDLIGMTADILASHIGLIFPDGSAKNVLTQLSSDLQSVLQTSVTKFGLHLVAVGGNSSIPGILGLIPNTKTSSLSSILQMIEVILQDVSVFIPGGAVISEFLNGLPAIIQLISGNGAVSLFGPQTPAPSCSTEQSTGLSGTTGTIDPLQTLIQLIQAKN